MQTEQVARTTMLRKEILTILHQNQIMPLPAAMANFPVDVADVSPEEPPRTRSRRPPRRRTSCSEGRKRARAPVFCPGPL